MLIINADSDIIEINASHNAYQSCVLIKARTTSGEFLGEYKKGDTIKIDGRLVASFGDTEVPISNETVFLYMSTEGSESIENSQLMGQTKTDNDGYFSFEVKVGEGFPTGEVTFIVYYPGSISKGFSATKVIYRAKIIEPTGEPQGGGQTGMAILVIVLLFAMMLTSVVISIKTAFKRREEKRGVPMWREILDTMISQARRRDINFVLLSRELVDSLCKQFGIIPKASATLLEKTMELRGFVGEKAFNIIKNMISTYELLSYGGPYARTILMSTFDFEVWKELLEDLSRMISEKLK